jgi:hypothetical protein
LAGKNSAAPPGYHPLREVLNRRPKDALHWCSQALEA